LSYEAELVGLALLLYLYDSSALLYANEAIFSCDSARRWSVSTGWAGFTLAGRTLCVLNPFTPHHPAFRLAWDLASVETPAIQSPAIQSPTGDSAWSARARLFDRLAPSSWLAWTALFVVLPVGLFTSAGAYAVVPALLLLYASSLVGLWRLRRLRHSTALGPPDRKRDWGFAFECLACPPFAANMIRRITLQERIAEPVPLAGTRLLDAERWNRLRTHCESRQR
jgi:hypothetical protein